MPEPGQVESHPAVGSPRGSSEVRGAPRRPTPPTAVTGRYLPALDGVRAFAVAGVLAYHLGYGWASGGFLGVDLFFVLSGFLITTLLLEEWVATATIKLMAFWARRARRLLPALFLLLIGIAAYVVIVGRFGSPGAAATIDLNGLRGDALATLFYAANWHSIFAHQSYFAQFSTPSPLQHTWSLAIEEQFYLIWPPVLLFVLRAFRRSWRQIGLIVTVGGFVLSSVLMVVLYHPGTDPTRVYFGTDTHIFDMLAGATVAMLAASRPQPGRRAQRVLHALAPLAALALGFFWVTGGTTGELPKGWMFHGGFFICAVLGAIIVADVRQFDLGPLGKLLALPPLRWIGQISYGIYLYHWPIFVYMNGARTGLSGTALNLARLALTLAVATLSFYLVEQPIRRRRFTGWPRFTLAPAAAVVTAAVLIVATVPAVAAPTKGAPPTQSVAVGGATVVPGSGGYRGQEPITVPPGTGTVAQPLRVMLLGDSVMQGSVSGITAALGSTGAVTVSSVTAQGFGLSTDTGWRTGLPASVVQADPDLIVATWSWDSYTVNGGPGLALTHPALYTAMLEQAITAMLNPGGGVHPSGIIFTQFPPTGPVLANTKAEANAAEALRRRGELAWQRIVASMPAKFPGQVMYLPLAGSLLLDGKYTNWLPPANNPGAPKAEWDRVRKIDAVHLCQAGVVRYADALLADMTSLFHLPRSTNRWSEGSWVNDPVFNDPPGACPDDKPPT
jgi:peptidoglycan/LPS O-acetylase OafA/YrhL